MAGAGATAVICNKERQPPYQGSRPIDRNMNVLTVLNGLKLSPDRYSLLALDFTGAAPLSKDELLGIAALISQRDSSNPKKQEIAQKKIAELEARLDTYQKVRQGFEAAGIGEEEQAVRKARRDEEFLRTIKNFLESLANVVGDNKGQVNSEKKTIAENRDLMRKPWEDAAGSGKSLAKTVASMVGSSLVFGAGGFALAKTEVLNFLTKIVPQFVNSVYGIVAGFAALGIAFGPLIVDSYIQGMQARINRKAGKRIRKQDDIERDFLAKRLRVLEIKVMQLYAQYHYLEDLNLMAPSKKVVDWAINGNWVELNRYISKAIRKIEQGIFGRMLDRIWWKRNGEGIVDFIKQTKTDVSAIDGSTDTTIVADKANPPPTGG
jgi:hypothetical protein